MKTSFFRKTAWSNIRKNYRFFIPRILSEMGLLGCFYIALTLVMDERLSEVRGGSLIGPLMVIGTTVLALLSTVLMFYINSFLMKQRKNEFGMYNVLGMEKRHVSRVMFHECLICSTVSVILGLAFGMLFYKLCALLICRLLKTEIILGFNYITPLSIIPSGLFFIGLDLITFCCNRISIGRMKPVELLASRQTGEKEPRVKWVMLVIGIAALAGGYTISITTENPADAIPMFFLAVVLVMIGTYFLFVTGSTFVLKVLKNNSHFYYNRRHMPAVSGLLYRMKQNAVGLASIAILATGVLVMLSTTVSLYTGMHNTLNSDYPEDMYVNLYLEEADQTPDISHEELKAIIENAAASVGVRTASIVCDEYIAIYYYVEDGVFLPEREVSEILSLSNLAQFKFITEETYTELSGKTLGLSGREFAICNAGSARSSGMPSGEVTIHGVKYNIVKEFENFPITGDHADMGIAEYGIVVADREIYNEIVKNQKECLERYASLPTVRARVIFDDREKAAEHGQELNDAIYEGFGKYYGGPEDRNFFCLTGSVWEEQEVLLGMYGVLLFLGILLGSVCIFATVLIIYYKQISEGYEDRERFQIMEKIGMSKAEVRNTINVQVLLVFFLPLIVAGIHMAFAYPILSRMLKLLMLYNSMFFFACTLITYAVFALIYVLIYKGTSRTYYKIVH